ncbi:sensor histidine kinase [Streptomyces physcomitrii]|uniref:histidine kinase n=1 Tax=Streptomyces physcomitrii TaxID=2724184 RepID=A0ABX1H434_9ACTN|nr:histidine kinase [Streptomyces physcomitrii]NKI42803.1 sensor histidine kinase [Streptomyces physcomitrii]
MTAEAWSRWPSREALSPAEMTPARRILTRAVRIMVVALVVWSGLADRDASVTVVVGAGFGLAVCAAAAWAFFRMTYRHRLRPSVLLLGVLLGAGIAAQEVGLAVPALVLWCVCAVTALERLPLFAAVPATAAALGAYIAVDNDAWIVTAVTTVGMCLAGYVLRLDAEARGSARRLLAQERAAREAERESAALAERARIAREIHDVLAHSLSAQLVHLEAARILLDQDAGREAVRERIVAARGMAKEGLDETRQALSALRGDMTPLEEYLKELVSLAEDGEVTVTGERCPLSAEASQAVRRVAQEALTNVRKHAPGARVALRLEYGGEHITLAVKDDGGPAGELAVAGAGYGLLGMRERAELLGGSLHAGPYEEGFMVRLKVPV